MSTHTHLLHTILHHPSTPNSYSPTSRRRHTMLHHPSTPDSYSPTSRRRRRPPRNSPSVVVMIISLIFITPNSQGFHTPQTELPHHHITLYYSFVVHSRSRSTVHRVTSAAYILETPHQFPIIIFP